jgi:hypothetical protein
MEALRIYKTGTPVCAPVKRVFTGEEDDRSGYGGGLKNLLRIPIVLQIWGSHIPIGTKLFNLTSQTDS